MRFGKCVDENCKKGGYCLVIFDQDSTDDLETAATTLNCPVVLLTASETIFSENIPAVEFI